MTFTGVKKKKYANKITASEDKSKVIKTLENTENEGFKKKIYNDCLVKYQSY